MQTPVLSATAITASIVTVVPGDCFVSTEADRRLVCRDIRSSVVLAVSAPSIGLAGLLRFAYPDSTANPPLAGESPRLFADTGIRELLALVREHGIADTDLRLYAAGAAAIPERGQPAAWGKANELALKKILWREKLYLASEDLGGTFARSIWLETSGRIIVGSERNRAAAAPAREMRHAI